MRRRASVLGVSMSTDVDNSASGGLAPVVAQQKNWLLCHDCGTLQVYHEARTHEALVCANCEKPLLTHRADWVERVTALSVAALVLFVCANAFNFLTVHIAGQTYSATIFSGVVALLDRNQWVLAGLVLTTIFLYPLLEIFALLYILIPFTLKRRLRGQITVFRYLVRAQPWNMLDVFLLGALVTAVKMQDVAEVEVDAGGYVFFVLVLVLQAAYWLTDKRNIWNWLNHNNCFSRGEIKSLSDCGVCGAMVCDEIIRAAHECPRCGSVLHRRKPNSLEKTTALLIAATVLYIPANLLPIMDYEELNESYSETILTGVFTLLKNNLWGVAGIVFVASIIVPIAKLIMLFYLVWSVKYRHNVAPKTRALMFRITEIIGRWSMVDVFVVTLLTAVVQFGFIGIVDPGAALLPFAAVVVLTMLAAEAFDPRLIWDAYSSDEGSLKVKPIAPKDAIVSAAVKEDNGAA